MILGIEHIVLTVPDGSANFCLMTDLPLEEWRDPLARHGVAVELGPIDRVGARGRMQSIYFRDPDLNVIEVSRYEDARIADRPRQRIEAPR